MTDTIKNPDPSKIQSELMGLINQLSPTSDIERRFLDSAVTGKYSPDLTRYYELRQIRNAIAAVHLYKAWEIMTLRENNMKPPALTPEMIAELREFIDDHPVIAKCDE